MSPGARQARPRRRKRGQEWLKPTRTRPAAGRSPSPPPISRRCSEKARDYARNARSENTQRAYDADWRQFASWLRRQGLDPLPPDPQTVGLYLAACVEGGPGRPPLSVSSLERRLSGICWRYRQLGRLLDTGDPHIATVLAGIRRAHGRPPVQKEAIFADELLAMLAVLDNDLRGLRDKAILAIGFAGGLRRSEIVGLDCGPEQTDDGTGWIEIVGADQNGGGLLLTLNGKTGWREVEIGRGSSPLTCPVAMLETWLGLGRITQRPGVPARSPARMAASPPSGSRTSMSPASCRKRALAAGLRGDLPEGERRAPSPATPCAPASPPRRRSRKAMCKGTSATPRAEMTRRYQRKRDRFKVNLTKAAGL